MRWEKLSLWMPDDSDRQAGMQCVPGIIALFESLSLQKVR